MSITKKKTSIKYLYVIFAQLAYIIHTFLFVIQKLYYSNYNECKNMIQICYSIPYVYVREICTFLVYKKYFHYLKKMRKMYLHVYSINICT